MIIPTVIRDKKRFLLRCFSGIDPSGRYTRQKPICTVRRRIRMLKLPISTPRFRYTIVVFARDCVAALLDQSYTKINTGGKQFCTFSRSTFVFHRILILREKQQPISAQSSHFTEFSFYRECTVQCILDKMGAHFTKTNMDFDQKLPFYRIPIFSRTQNFAKEAK